jgi:hypothetical protein
MRQLVMFLMLGSAILGAPRFGAARTSGRTCRTDCAPRIEEQCGDLAGGARRRCQRPLLRACKATTPAIACETTADLTRELADRKVRLANAVQTELTLCESRQFLLTELPPNFDPNDPSVGNEAFGTWAVHVVGGALGLVLADQEANAPRRLERNAAGTLLVDGVPAELDDAAATCAVTTFDPSDAQRAALVALSRALADRTLVLPEDGSSQETLTLCSSGRLLHETLDTVTAAVVSAIDGSWTIDVGGSNILLLDQGNATVPFGLEVRADGAVLLDDAVVEQRDARAVCADLDLTDRLTAALAGKVFHFTQQLGAIPVRTKLGLCDSGRYTLDTTSSEHGTWRVAVINGIAAIRLVDDQGVPQLPAFRAAFDATGGVTVQGTAPVDDPAELAAACNG